MSNRGPLRPEEYLEPDCPLCGSPAGVQPYGRPVPQQRILAKLDDYMSRRDYAGAERHLQYWLEEARQLGDLRGELMLRGELVGHYRKTGDKEKALFHGEAALKLLDAMDFGGTLTAGTTCVNVATALNAFGEYERAMSLFERARSIYEAGEAPPRLLGGLYNNLALNCAALGRWDQADTLYDMAMDCMARETNGQLEQAMTCLNRANLVEARDGMEAGEGRVFALLEQALALLDDPALPRDGYYAFVLEKCAPTFDYYGWFLDAQRLKDEAERIYGEQGSRQ